MRSYYLLGKRANTGIMSEDQDRITRSSLQHVVDFTCAYKIQVGCGLKGCLRAQPLIGFKRASSC
jgi:hypothetical protein